MPSRFFSAQNRFTHPALRCVWTQQPASTHLEPLGNLRKHSYDYIAEGRTGSCLRNIPYTHTHTETHTHSSYVIWRWPITAVIGDSERVLSSLQGRSPPTSGCIPSTPDHKTLTARSLCRHANRYTSLARNVGEFGCTLWCQFRVADKACYYVLVFKVINW
jgi:hypothetical protein